MMLFHSWFKNKEVEAIAPTPVQAYINDSISIDFSMLKVFSIERINEADALHPTTVVGYVDGNGACLEWYFGYISDARHDKLVEEFNNHIATRSCSKDTKIKGLVLSKGKNDK